MKAAFPASNAEWAEKKCKLTREYLARREREAEEGREMGYQTELTELTELREQFKRYHGGYGDFLHEGIGEWGFTGEVLAKSWTAESFLGEAPRSRAGRVDPPPWNSARTRSSR